MGLQICFGATWNMFNDPYSAVIFLLTILICKGFQITTVTIANYLEIWYIPMADVDFSSVRGFADVKGLDEELM